MVDHQVVNQVMDHLMGPLENDPLVNPQVEVFQVDHLVVP
jgi:hypothetical protein